MRYVKDRIYFHHQRPSGYYLVTQRDGSVVEADLSKSPKGGITFAIKVDTDTKEIIYADAACSMKDNFNRKVGRAIAQGRLDKHRCFAISADPLPDKFRDLIRLVMEDYATVTGFVTYETDPGLCHTLDMCLWEPLSEENIGISKEMAIDAAKSINDLRATASGS